MSYIGNEPAALGTYATQSFTGNGVLTAFTLSQAATTATILVSIDGVDQIPTTAYSVATDGVTLNFTSAPPDTTTISVRFLGDVVDFGEPSDNSVTSAKIADGTIVNADINASAAIAQSKLSLDIVNANINASAAIATSKISGLAASATTDTTSATNISSGTLGTARLGTGTASSSTFLRGDQSWAAAGGDNTPSFYAYNASSQSLSATTSTKVTLDTEGWDTDSAFASNTFTVPSGEGGKYWFTFGGYFNDIPYDNYARMSLMKNDVGIDQTTNQHWGAGGQTEPLAFSCSAAVELAATDTLDVQMYTETSGGLTVYYCFLSGIKLAGV